MNAAHIDPASAGQFPGQFSPLGGRQDPHDTKFRAQARGSTAVDETHNGPRHLVGSALRAIRIFADTAIRVAVFGREGVRL